ncbi:MAG: DUF1491 family protein, partial [Methyloligellaceae bacterium]
MSPGGSGDGSNGSGMTRTKSEIWVKGYVRRCYGENCPAVIVRRGDGDAGAIFI